MTKLGRTLFVAATAAEARAARPFAIGDDLAASIASLRDITERGKAMGLGLVAYPVGDVERVLAVLDPGEKAQPQPAKPRPRVVACAIITQFNTIRVWWQIRPVVLPEMAFGERYVELIEAEDVQS